MKLKDASVLVVDDDRDLLTAVRMLLVQKVKKVFVENNPETLINILGKEPIDLVLLDMNFKSVINTGNEGLYWLAEIKKSFPRIKIVMITAYGAVDLAVKSLKRGASDFLVKPWLNETLLETLSVALDEKNFSEADRVARLNPQKRSPQLLGKSVVMEELQYKMTKIAPTDANILLLGENGTGKDLIADAIQQLSLRANKAYVKVDLGSLTETLFESELFGYKKGAFTDAREDRKGRFEIASGGTLFLDEIGNITLQQQAKLLSVLQNRQVIPLGASQPLAIDIRLLTATNVPLGQLADEKRFRKDLIYRINTVEIQVPPLRERGEDILLLANHFLRVYAEKYHKTLHGFEGDGEKKLMGYHFPGNVRELQYCIERAVIMADRDTLSADDLLFSPLERNSPGEAVLEHLPRNLEELERKAIQSALERYQGNISKAARELGLTRAALYRRIDKYEI